MTFKTENIIEITWIVKEYALSKNLQCVPYTKLKEIIDVLSDKFEILHIIDVDAVFVNKNGKRLNENNIQAIFRTYGDGMMPHMIRHWYATVMAKTGDLTFVQQQLGHSSVNTTVNNYANGIYGMKDVLANM